MKLQNPQKRDKTINFRLWRAMKKAKEDHSYPLVAKMFGMTAKQVEYHLKRGPPTGIRSVKRELKAKRDDRATLAVELSKKYIIKTTQLGAKQCTDRVPKYPTCRVIAAAIGQIKKMKKPPSAETIRLDLKKAGLFPYRIPKTALLTDDSKKKRVRFARGMLKSTIHTDICFSDESQADRNPTGMKFQWAPNREAASAVMGTTASGPRVMFWGVIGLGYKSDLVILPKDKDTNVTAKTYRRLCLTKKIAKALENRSFMQDNAPIHTAKIITKKLQDLNMQVVPGWPPHSPDLNPIEQVWAIIKRRIESHPDLHTKAGLTAAVQAEWAALSQETIDKMVSSFPQRLRAVVKAGGKRVR